MPTRMTEHEIFHVPGHYDSRDERIRADLPSGWYYWFAPFTTPYGPFASWTMADAARRTPMPPAKASDPHQRVEVFQVDDGRLVVRSLHDGTNLAYFDRDTEGYTAAISFMRSHDLRWLPYQLQPEPEQEEPIMIPPHSTPALLAEMRSTIDRIQARLTKGVSAMGYPITEAQRARQQDQLEEAAQRLAFAEAICDPQPHKLPPEEKEA